MSRPGVLLQILSDGWGGYLRYSSIPSFSGGRNVVGAGRHILLYTVAGMLPPVLWVPATACEGHNAPDT